MADATHSKPEDLMGTHAVPPDSDLSRSEQELALAMVDQFEAFYRQGTILERILEEKEFRNAGYSSFDEYMSDRQPLGIKRARAWQLIKAKNIRCLLPGLNGENSTRVESLPGWTEKAIRPLTHKDFNRSEVRKLGKKIATQVRHGRPLTEKLVKEICDTARGVERRRHEKKTQEILDTPTLAEEIGRMTTEVGLWDLSLDQIPEDLWEEAMSEDSRCVKDFIRALSGLAEKAKQKSHDVTSLR